MFALLPDLAPRDSHSLWYTSSRNPLQSLSGSGGISSAHDAAAAAAHLASPHHEHSPHNHLHPHPHFGGGGGGGANANRRGAAAQLLLERSPLARLRADEQNLERRRQNVTNFGAAWLKPPGLPKTLHQLREEQREAEEHQEALRREQLAQELAEAEAEAAGAAAAAAGATAGGGDVAGNPDAMLDAPAGGAGGDDGMDDVQLDGARDLDDDIPEADAADFGFSGNEDDDDEEDEEDEEEDEEDDENAERAAQAQQQHLMAQRMRQGNDAFREDMARGRDSAAFYGGDEEIDDEDQSQMIEEDDFAGGHGGMDDMGMDADLDDEIPEAESMGGYEHTDSEAELSSIIDEGNNSRMSFVASQQPNRFRHSLARSDATRNSIAISDILSRDGSSVLGSSPAVSRRRSGVSRRGRG
ncbi:Apc15p protein-domain-containing protein [Nemania sp. FL0031]|nr:Apc15p protein-domain-containing protein [Nemania sp. FL0031]